MPAATGDSFTIPAQSGAAAAHRSARSAIAALWNAARAAAKRANAYRSLQNLDDRALKDIGVHRTEITSILHYDRQDPSRRPR